MLRMPKRAAIWLWASVSSLATAHRRFQLFAAAWMIGVIVRHAAPGRPEVHEYCQSELSMCRSKDSTVNSSGSSSRRGFLHSPQIGRLQYGRRRHDLWRGSGGIQFVESPPLSSSCKSDNTNIVIDIYENCKRLLAYATPFPQLC
jgi:hypothetical protein